MSDANNQYGQQPYNPQDPANQQPSEQSNQAPQSNGQQSYGQPQYAQQQNAGQYTPQPSAAPQYGQAPYTGQAQGQPYNQGYEQQYAQPGNYAQQPAYGYAPQMVSSKSKIVAGLLGIFLGTFGVHNFYLGRTGKAIAQLLITLLSFGFLAVVSGIWALIEGIMILASHPGSPWHQDGQGFELQD